MSRPATEFATRSVTKLEKRLVEEFLFGLTCGVVPEPIISKNIRFWSITAGECDRDDYIDGIGIIASLFESGIVYDVTAMKIEQECVVVEARGSGRMKDGADYNNGYVFVFQISEGRISFVWEYFDPQPVRDLLTQPVLQALKDLRSQS